MVCDGAGRQQLVKQPTREDYLLDLLFSDIDGIRCKVLPQIADHKSLLLPLPLPVPRVAVQTRLVWQFRHADWDGLRNALALTDWSSLSGADANQCAQCLTETISELSRKFIPQRTLKERKSTHPWVNERIIKLVELKQAAEGTANEASRRAQCSAAILDEYGRYIARERKGLQELPRGAKAWWTKSRRVLQRKGLTSSIPALRNPDDQWILECKEKGNLFVDSFSAKFTMTEAETNVYTELETYPYKGQEYLYQITCEDAERLLANLREDSGTGPDLLPARILKQCAAALAKPVQLLMHCIMDSGMWPELWRQHWVVPLHKKKNVFEQINYCGIHLTPQLSKVIERLLKLTYVPYISRISVFGPSQFAYTLGRGARDALATLVQHGFGHSL